MISAVLYSTIFIFNIYELAIELGPEIYDWIFIQVPPDKCSKIRYLLWNTM